MNRKSYGSVFSARGGKGNRSEYGDLEGKHHGRASPWRPVETDGATVVDHDLVADGQPEAGSLATLGTEEWLERLRLRGG